VDVVVGLAAEENMRRLRNCKTTDEWLAAGWMSQRHSNSRVDFDEDLDIDEVRLSSMSPRSDVRFAVLFLTHDPVHTSPASVTGQHESDQ